MRPHRLRQGRLPWRGPVPGSSRSPSPVARKVEGRKSGWQHGVLGAGGSLPPIGEGGAAFKHAAGKTGDLPYKSCVLAGNCAASPSFGRRIVLISRRAAAAATDLRPEKDCAYVDSGYRPDRPGSDGLQSRPQHCEKGYTIAVHNRSPGRIDEFVAEAKARASMARPSRNTTSPTSSRP